ncbi:hypothetical protein BBH88_03320 [Planococcus antarcticus DSM 14505]|uniref:Uncharacterized protein n=1 Tax=Planococcus antarcticus DSM 14505 TaxID=1185653 RepID=A0ABN4RI35_9BACL|nr:hypothetical protein [Planococcus antarcticus]ANU09407.1 hypothetical protein BBH88_03320 [Planococcus antarcticus DSM 14505]
MAIKKRVIRDNNEQYHHRRSALNTHKEVEVVGEKVANVEQEEWGNNVVPDVINTMKKEDAKPLSKVENADRYPLITFSKNGAKVLRQAKFPTEEYEFYIDQTRMRLNLEGKYGNYDQLLITFSLRSLDSKSQGQLTLLYTVSSSSSSEYIKFLSSFEEIFIGQSITVEHLVGLVGRCSISHFEAESGDVYDRLKVLEVNQPI